MRNKKRTGEHRMVSYTSFSSTGMSERVGKHGDRAIKEQLLLHLLLPGHCHHAPFLTLSLASVHLSNLEKIRSFTLASAMRLERFATIQTHGMVLYDDCALNHFEGKKMAATDHQL